jgi:3-vinyl bacteriochlorophyllide hydratase
MTGEGVFAASVSVVVKTVVLYTIMVTGAIWEKKVFDCYLFAPAFYWEDVFSMLVLALHTAYLGALFTGALGSRGQLLLALAAYGTYLINATQFILKLRAARLGAAAEARAMSQRAVEGQA